MNAPMHRGAIITAALNLVVCVEAGALNDEFAASRSEALQEIVERAVAATVTQFSVTKVKAEELAVTVVNLRDPQGLRSGSHRGEARIYPASVIKLFYLEAAHRWMEEGKMQDTPELRRALRDMIVDSYNEATHYVVDVLTETTSGPELPAEEMRAWEFKRNAVNRYFQARGFPNINASQKPWGEGPYGRERRFVGEQYTNRNALTTDTTARLLAEIALRRAVSAKRSGEMLELLARDPFAETKTPDEQARDFIGRALPRGTKLWSKAGWTSQVRHDAAYLELPGRAKFVLVIFTVNHAHEREIISTLANRVISAMENGS